MPKDTETSPLLEGMDHLIATQDQHTDILTQLERRPVPDLDGLARRLEDVADAVDRLQAPASPERLGMHGWWWSGGMLVLGVLTGWWLCWSTVRYLPSPLLPPGFSRTVPGTPMKGKF